MKGILRWSTFFVLLASAAPCGADEPRQLDTALIERLTGVKGAWNDQEGVFKVSAPRDDLRVIAAGVRISPPLGLTSWAAFTATDEGTMVMGDLALTEDQVASVMDSVFSAGLDVTALHNHFFWDAPKVMFMHISGHGRLESLASGVGHVLARIRETGGGRALIPRADIDPAKSAIDVSTITSILGHKGEMSKGVYKVTIGRETRMQGRNVGAAMGVNTWAAFAGTDALAVVDGDFAVVEGELQAVLKALRSAKILVVAIHNHMTFESPRIVFLHYWGVGPAAELARAVRSALDKAKS
jgi:hypothetical protein